MTPPPSAAGLPLVFVHGMRVSGTMWHPVIDALGTRHPALAPDLPGHGSRRGEPFTLSGAVAAVADAIDELGGRAMVIGLSLGGYVATATAARHPERVSGLMAMGCTAVPRGMLRTAYRRAARLGGRHPEAANRLSAYAFRRALPAPLAEAMVAGGLSSELMPSIIETVCGMDPVSLLAAYPGPVWLVNGARDQLRRDERRFLAACRDGRLVVRPRCGHLSVLSDTAAVTRQILDAATVVAARTHAPTTADGTVQEGAGR
ncbi:alpha/beta fold hydrolase [Streptomyces sp. NRRL S-1448]|uniref:alpha/beta fold hydrolase n=1 Tax=Streptomyces sp. NRRL S-1448 TaxID=1463883 RepID=UPI00056CC4C3|nr:alpha/beta hydrolase [Streptomyces sp. NRRL S-1448]